MTILQKGAGNHCYGKHYTDEEKKHFAVKTREKWKDPKYREKVIANATGIKRSNEFRAGQSLRTKKSYDKIDGLREKRGKLFSECWKNGKNHFHSCIAKKSSEEIEIKDYLKGLGKYTITTNEIKVENGYVAPDMIVNGHIVVEFYGDYYHADPAKYADDVFIKRKGMTAKEVRECDRIREDKIKDAGYKLIVIWQHEYRADKQNVLANLVDKIETILKEED